MHIEVFFYMCVWVSIFGSIAVASSFFDWEITRALKCSDIGKMSKKSKDFFFSIIIVTTLISHFIWETLLPRYKQQFQKLISGTDNWMLRCYFLKQQFEENYQLDQACTTWPAKAFYLAHEAQNCSFFHKNILWMLKTCKFCPFYIGKIFLGPP